MTSYFPHSASCEWSSIHQQLLFHLDTRGFKVCPHSFKWTFGGAYIKPPTPMRAYRYVHPPSRIYMEIYKSRLESPVRPLSSDDERGGEREKRK